MIKKSEKQETKKTVIELPPEFLLYYEPQKCLSRSAISETHLVRLRESGKEYIAKIYDRFFVEENADERVILEKLSHPMVPKLTDCVETDKLVCVIRDYAEGTSLDELPTPVSEGTLRMIGTQLCDILTYLHEQTPPIIHRDIKPSNVVINDENEVRLIDFDISRQYDEEADSDTNLVATCGYSSPEQYGFGQTDARSDIFSFGKTLCWLMTGSKDIADIKKIQNLYLRRMIKKCANLAPGKRYQTAEAAKKALMYSTDKWRAQSISIVVSAAVILFSSGFFVGRLTAAVPILETSPPVANFSGGPVEEPSDVLVDDSLDSPDTVGDASLKEATPTPLPTPENDPVTQEQDDERDAEAHTFTEPLVEQAVRSILNKGDDEPVTYGELKTITEIHFHGTLFYGAWPEPGMELTFGNISNLEDFRAMENLETLALIRQTFTDVSPLADLNQLSLLLISQCNVADLSPLAELPRLDTLELNAILATDFSFVHSINTLRHFKAVNLPIFSIADLGSPPSLHSLALHTHTLDSLDGIEHMIWLDALHIGATSITDFSPLNDKGALPRLKQFSISPDMEQYLHTLDRDDLEVWW